MHIAKIWTLFAWACLGTTSAIAQSFSIYVSNFTGEDVDGFEIKFDGFRNAGVISPGGNVSIACIQRTWPRAVEVKGTQRGDSKGGTVALKPLAVPNEATQ
jgi:hypothetical protein